MTFAHARRREKIRLYLVIVARARVAVVLAVRDAPRVIRHEQQRVADGADHIVGELCGWVGEEEEAGRIPMGQRWWAGSMIRRI